MNDQPRIRPCCLFKSSQNRRESSKMFEILQVSSALESSLGIDKWGHTKVDIVFSALVVKLSIIKVNSSSVISSRIHGPRNDGGLVTCGTCWDEVVTANRAEPNFGEVGSDDGGAGGLCCAADSASRRRTRDDSSLTCSISIDRDAEWNFWALTSTLALISFEISNLPTSALG
jgi:hypothetical protein